MITSKVPIYLASGSPRRKNLLKMIGIKFRTIQIDTEEKIELSQTAVKNVKRLAVEKSEYALKKINNGIVIAADTIVVIDGEIIGKPKNKKDAVIILQKLSGRSHYVYTGYSIVNKSRNKKITSYSKTKVFFKKLSLKEIKDYIKTGSPMDKAGAYGIQDDYGAVFVDKIIGSYYNVLGFPISKIYDGLKNII